MTDVRREQTPSLWSTVGETALAKGCFFLTQGHKVSVCRGTKLPGRGVHSEVREIGKI